MQDDEKLHNYDEVIDEDEKPSNKKKHHHHHKKESTVQISDTGDSKDLKQKLSDVDKQIAEMEAKIANNKEKEMKVMEINAT